MSDAKEAEPGRQRRAMVVAQCDNGFSGLQTGAVQDVGPGYKDRTCWLIQFWLTEVRRPQSLHRDLLEAKEIDGSGAKGTKQCERAASI